MPHVFIAYDPLLINKTPFSPHLIHAFYTRLQTAWQYHAPGVSLWLDEDQPTGTNKASAIEAALKEAVGVIALIGAEREHPKVMERLNIFKQRTEFLFGSSSDRKFKGRIRVVGVATNQPLEFDNSFFEVEDCLEPGKEETFTEAANQIAIEYGAQLSSRYPSIGRVVLGIGAPDDEYQFRQKLHTQLAQKRFEVVDVKDFAHMTPERAEAQLTTAMTGASAVFHFLSKRLEIGWRLQNKFCLDLQIDVATKVGVPQIYCGGPSVVEPEQTPSATHGREIMRRIKKFDNVNECWVDFNAMLQDDRLRALAANRSTVTICLVGADRDKDALEKIEAYLSTYDWEVVSPIGTSKTAETFKQSRFVLFYWGAGSPTWHKYNWEQLEDAKVEQEQRTIDVAGIYFAKEKIKPKETLATSKITALVERIEIDDYQPMALWDHFSETGLQPFVAAVQAHI